MGPEILGRWIHEAYQFKGFTFFVNCQVRKPEVGIWLWFLGSEADAKKFRVKITLGDPNNMVKHRNWFQSETISCPYNFIIIIVLTLAHWMFRMTLPCLGKAQFTPFENPTIKLWTKDVAWVPQFILLNLYGGKGIVLLSVPIGKLDFSSRFVCHKFRIVYIFPQPTE